MSRESAEARGYTDPAPPLAEDIEERGDLLIADRFVGECGEDFRFTPGIGWLRWGGSIWERCELGEQLEEIKGVARRMIAAGADTHERTAWAAMQLPRVKGALGFAEVDPAIAVPARALDSDPYLLATPDGTVELRTGVLRPARRDDLLTCSTAMAPAEGRAPAWDAFLARVQPDADARRFMQRLVGAAVVGAVREHLLPVLHGDGANGKSVFTTVLVRVLGGYAHAAPIGLLMQGRRGGGVASPEAADLRGRRFVVVSESREDGSLDVERVKALTGGDEIVARHLYRDPIRFRPSHTIFLVTNHRPRIEDDGNAIWRRVMLLPWEVAIPEAEQDGELADRLVEEAGGGILRWIIDGARDYLRAGLDVPKVVTDATADYRDREDWFGTWLTERTASHKDATVRSGELMADYREWAASSSGGALTDAAMRERLEARGFTRETHRGRVSWRGLRLSTHEERQA